MTYSRKEQWKVYSENCAKYPGALRLRSLFLNGLSTGQSALLADDIGPRFPPLATRGGFFVALLVGEREPS